MIMEGNFKIQQGATTANGFIVNKFLNYTLPNGEPITLLIPNNGQDTLHPWFIGKEIGLALGYTIGSYRDALNRLVPKEDISIIPIYSSMLIDNSVGNPNGINLGETRGNPNTTIISLPGVMYWAIRSHASNADAFANWVIYDVLLSINNLQGYFTPEMIEQLKLNPGMINPYLNQMIEYQNQIAQLQHQLSLKQMYHLIPKDRYPFNDYYKMKDYLSENRDYIATGKAITNSNEDISINLLAKMLQQFGYPTGEHKLYEELRADGFLMKTKDNYNYPTQKALDLEVLRVVYNEERIYTDEATVPVYVTKVTPKGINYFGNYFYKKLLAMQNN